MSFVSCYSGWQLKGADETEPAGTDGLCGCEDRCGGGTAKGAGGTSFSQSITLEGARLLSSAPLPSLAQVWTDLALYIFDGSFHPCKCSLYAHSLAAKWVAEPLTTLKSVPWTCGVLLCTGWLGPKARAAS